MNKKSHGEAKKSDFISEMEEFESISNKEERLHKERLQDEFIEEIISIIDKRTKDIDLKKVLNKEAKKNDKRGG